VTDINPTNEGAHQHMDDTRSLRPPGRRLLLGAGLAAAALAGTLVTANASSHREAPLITEDPVADNTDLYAYVSPDAPDAVTLIANFQGFEEPGGGPNYFRFGDDVLYAIKIDNTGDAVPDVIYEFRFTTTTRDPSTFLYATGAITSPTDTDWNRPQTYTVTRVAGGRRTVVASNLASPPSNAGPRSTPNYAATAAAAVHSLPGGGRVFAGQRAEGFYADIASIFDLGGLRPLNAAHAVPPNTNEPGRNTFAGYNVQSIALQVPKADVTRQGDPVIGVWSTTSRRKVRVFANDNGAMQSHRGRWVQVSRLGNPLVNEVVVPLLLKDAFNGLRPQGDADVPGLPALVSDPELGRRIEALYPGVDVPPAPRNDLVSIFLTGIDGLNKPAGTVRPAEVLRLNTSIAPTPAANRNRLALLAGQNDGFPNGRRVGDDVTDIALRAVAGGTPFTPDFNRAPNNALTDGVDASDQPYLDVFPYLGTPYQGYELNNQTRDGD
jgi:hypothetical protein